MGGGGHTIFLSMGGGGHTIILSMGGGGQGQGGGVGTTHGVGGGRITHGVGGALGVITLLQLESSEQSLSPLFC
jgi:hypothetical protein